jgi:dUTP pyrophosphatase
LKIKIKKLDDHAVIPQYQTAGAAGFDLHSVIKVMLHPGERALINTGLAMEIEDGYELQIRPRSGLAYKYGITVLNAPGTIDSDYRGEIKVLLINNSNETFTIQQNERIAQGVVQAVIQASFEEVKELSDTDRGTGGFGSTGK